MTQFISVSFKRFLQIISHFLSLKTLVNLARTSNINVVFFCLVHIDVSSMESPTMGPPTVCVHKPNSSSTQKWWKVIIIVVSNLTLWKEGWTRAQKGKRRVAWWPRLAGMVLGDDGPAGKSAAAGRDKWLAPVTAPHILKTHWLSFSLYRYVK